MITKPNSHTLKKLGGVVLWAMLTGTPLRAQEAVRLHPENGHYFLFRGNPVVLVGSSEHYGALIHLDFDYVRYLEVTQLSGLNLVRVFTGTYREYPGAFGIPENTLAPSTARSIAPWKRTAVTGAADGGNKFDLNQWDPEYFSRLRDLVTEAGLRGIVVELTLFSAIYEDSSWSLSPMNAANHINGVGAGGRLDCYNAFGGLVPFQRALARKCATELAGFDNVIFEICNEPYWNNITQTWQNAIIDELVATEAGLQDRHLIAQNVFNDQGVITNPHPAVSLFNFHYALPNAAVQNYGLNRALGDDETGFDGPEDFPYRREAWEFMLSGGGLFDHLDYSYTATNEDGTAIQSAPGGGGPAIRQQLSVLRKFLEGLPLVNLRPQPAFVAGGLPAGAEARTMGEPGVAYGVYLRGGSQANLSVNLPAGMYRGEWIDTKSGQVAGTIADFIHEGGTTTLASPTYSEDIALRIFGPGPPATGPELLVNGSFENHYAGWLQAGNQSIQATGVGQHVEFNGGNLPPDGVLSQSFPTTVGLTYQLTFDAGVIAHNSDLQHLEVTVAGQPLLLSQVVSLTGLGNGETLWIPQQFTFVANGATTTLTFRDQSTSTIDLDLLLDNVTVTGPAWSGVPSISGVPGSITIRMAATMAGVYVLERSPDLAVWEQIDTLQLSGPGLVEFHDPQSTVPGSNAAMFYRIGHQP